MKKLFIFMLAMLLMLEISLPLAPVAIAAPDAMTVISNDDNSDGAVTVITKVYNKAGGVNTMVDISGFPLDAVRAWEPDPYPSTYPVEPPEAIDSIWDNGVNWFEDNFSNADWIWETHRAEDPATIYPAANPLYDADAARWGRVVLFETTFFIPGNPTGAMLHIAADNGYEAWVNGGTHIMAPTVSGAGWENSDLKQASLATSGWQTVGHHPIASSDLVAGTNILYILAGNEYFWGDDPPNFDNPTDPPNQYNPGAAIFQLDIELEPELAEISDFVWLDTNGNGIQDVGEPGIDNVTVNLYHSSNDTLAGTTMTTGGGIYSFTGLTPGDYYVEFILPANYIFTLKDIGTDEKDSDADTTTGKTVGTTLDPGETDNTWDAGLFPTGNLEIHKLRTGTAEGLDGWDFSISGPVADSGTTSGGGILIFSNIPIGDYTVNETLKSGWVNTDPGVGPPYQKQAIVVIGDTVIVEFANQELGDLQIFKYYDANSSGSYDAGDSPMANWVFTVSGVPGTFITNSSGLTTVPDLIPGPYTVIETLKAGWQCTDPGPSLQKEVAVTAGQTTNVLFGNYQPTGDLIIYKYDDEQGDGEHNGDEPLLDGWKFSIYGPIEGSGTTSGGRLILNNIPIGEYCVVESLQNGWCNTDPGDYAPYVKCVQVNIDQTTEVYFGNQQLGNIRIFKYNDLLGDGEFNGADSGLMGWGFNVSGKSRSFTTGVGGYVTVTGLVPGLHTVTEALPRLPYWECTDPGPSLQKDVMVERGATVDVQFGNYEVEHLVPALDERGIIALVVVFAGLLVWLGVRKWRMALTH